MKDSVPFRSKLLKPCRKLLHTFKFNIKRHTKDGKASLKACITALLSFYRSFKMSKEKKVAKLGEIQNISNTENETLLNPFVTPAYKRDLETGEASYQGIVEYAFYIQEFCELLGEDNN